MLVAGAWLVLIPILGLYFYKSNRLDQKTWFLKIVLWTIPIPYIANTVGWYMTEVGRMPWIVYGLQKVDAGLSTSVSVLSIMITLVGFTLIYGVLAVADVYLLLKFIKKGPEEVSTEETLKSRIKGASLWT
jgi:cytochrome bd ubiquinol oxidase subunit I